MKAWVEGKGGGATRTVAATQAMMIRHHPKFVDAVAGVAKQMFDDRHRWLSQWRALCGSLNGVTVFADETQAARAVAVQTRQRCARWPCARAGCTMRLS